MKSFFECEFLKQEWVPVDDFTVMQTEVVLRDVKPSGEAVFSKFEVEYKCRWKKQQSWQTRPTILIPIKDNLSLLEVTLKNLKDNEIDQNFNVIIIDDRSEEEIEKLVADNNLSYLRVDNNKGFNFSMLNNIAAKNCKELTIDTIVLWNSDLWCASGEATLELLRRHKENKSQISGSKLIYPPANMSLRNQEDTINIANHFAHMKGKWRNTVQFGGDAWVPTSNTSPLLVSPIHFKRFADMKNPIR